MVLILLSSSGLWVGTMEANLLALKPGKDSLLGVSPSVVVLSVDLGPVAAAPKDNLEGAKMDPDPGRRPGVLDEAGSTVLASLGLDIF